MMFLWYWMLFLMADVAGYHGGDGAGQDPPPPGGFRGDRHYLEGGKSYYKLFV
jgi:hypothetical protein